MLRDQELLAAVLDAPDDDAPRLVYADWLEQRGDPRGELIQVQCSLARFDLTAQRRADLEKRERGILRKHRPSWLEAMGLRGQTCEFRRGFLESITLSWERFFSMGDALFAAEPIRSLKLHQGGAEPRRLAASPLLTRLATLDLTGVAIGPEGMKALTRSPFVTGLRELVLGGAEIGREGFLALAGSTRLAGLRALDVSGTHLGDDGLALLAESPCLAGLRTLAAASDAIGAPGVGALARSPLALEGLDLGANFLDPDAVEALAASPLTPTLEDLTLTRNAIGPTGGLTLAAMPSPRLRSLALSYCKLSNLGATALAQRDAPGVLERLHLHENQIANDGVRDLASSAGLARLRELDLSGNLFGDTGARALAEASFAGSLVALDVSGHAMSEEGRAALTCSKHFTLLRQLVLAHDDTRIFEPARHVASGTPHPRQLGASWRFPGARSR